MIIVLGHASLIDEKIYEAPVNTYVETLIKQKRDFVFIRHFIDGNLKSTVYCYKKGRIVSQKKLFIISKIPPLRYLTEIVSSFLYLFRYKNAEVMIAADPLNAYTGLLLKRFRRLKKLIFVTCDYSERRFNNSILNWIFFKVDRIVASGSDQIWNVSKRIQEVRRSMGFPEEKNILVPNVPSSNYKQYVDNKRNKFCMVTLGLLGDQLEFDYLFEAIKDLLKKYPNLILKIIGNGPKEEYLHQKAKKMAIENSVIFTGHLDHDKALEHISKSGIGLALYNGNWNFNFFGDSMKCREFFCFGLPVITTDTHSTVEDIRENNAGIVVEMNKKSYISAVEEILNNYDLYSKNSFVLANKYEDIHNKLLKRIIGKDV